VTPRSNPQARQRSNRLPRRRTNRQLAPRPNQLMGRRPNQQARRRIDRQARGQNVVHSTRSNTVPIMARYAGVMGNPRDRSINGWPAAVPCQFCRRCRHTPQNYRLLFLRSDLHCRGELSDPLVKQDCFREKYPPLGAARGFKNERRASTLLSAAIQLQLSCRFCRLLHS